jgi:hypothetical protein
MALELTLLGISVRKMWSITEMKIYWRGKYPQQSVRKFEAILTGSAVWFPRLNFASYGARVQVCALEGIVRGYYMAVIRDLLCEPSFWLLPSNVRIA